jgi:hypothetical protein
VVVVVVALVVVECVVMVVVVEDEESTLNFGWKIQHGHMISDFELTLVFFYKSLQYNTDIQRSTR